MSAPAGSPQRTARVAPLTDAELAALDPAVRAGFEQLRLIERRPTAALRVLANHARLCQAWFEVAAVLVNEGALPDRDRELVVLRVAARRRCPAVWGFHVLIARKIGMPDDEIYAVAEHTIDDRWDAADALLLKTTDEILECSRIGAEHFAALRRRYDAAQLVELPLLVSFFAGNCAFFEGLQVPLDPGVPALPPSRWPPDDRRRRAPGAAGGGGPIRLGGIAGPRRRPARGASPGRERPGN